MHFLTEPLDAGVSRFTLEGPMLRLQPTTAASYALLTVDEAHHLYPDPSARKIIESHVTAGTTRRLLLSDM